MVASGLGIGLADLLVRRAKVDAGGLEALVTHLFLDDRKRQLV